MEDRKKTLSSQLRLLGICERYIIDRRLEEGGIHFGQPPILHLLSENPNATQKDIANALHISPASVSVSLKRLEKAGVISRETDKSDVRKNKLSLTEKGAELEKFARQTFDDVDEVKLSRLTDGEIETLISLIGKMNDNLLGLIPESRKCSFKQKEEDKNA